METNKQLKIKIKTRIISIKEGNTEALMMKINIIKGQGIIKKKNTKKTGEAGMIQNTEKRNRNKKSNVVHVEPFIR